MTNSKKTVSPAQVARMAGIWWLAFILVGPVSYLVVDGKLLVAGDATTTISNINSNVALFWLGVAAFLAGYTFFIFLGKTLCKLWGPVDSKLTKWMMGLVIAGTALVIVGKIAEIAGANVSNIEDAACLFDLRTNIEMAGELFWGLWLIPLVILIFKSTLIPKIIGGALIGTVVSHLTIFVGFFIGGVALDTNPIVLLLGLGEIIITLWLLIKGVK